VQLESVGIPTVVVTTTSFEPLTQQVAAAYGVPDARIAVVAHPLGGISEDDVIERADGAVEQVLSLLTGAG
jgi:hypothetical protein